jgi:hypothetical protein
LNDKHAVKCCVCGAPFDDMYAEDHEEAVPGLSNEWTQARRGAGAEK